MNKTKRIPGNLKKKMLRRGTCANPGGVTVAAPGTREYQRLMKSSSEDQKQFLTKKYR
jgi:hypothetical protein